MKPVPRRGATQRCFVHLGHCSTAGVDPITSWTWSRRSIYGRPNKPRDQDSVPFVSRGPFGAPPTLSSFVCSHLPMCPSTRRQLCTGRGVGTSQFRFGERGGEDVPRSWRTSPNQHACARHDLDVPVTDNRRLEVVSMGFLCAKEPSWQWTPRWCAHCMPTGLIEEVCLQRDGVALKAARWRKVATYPLPHSRAKLVVVVVEVWGGEEGGCGGQARHALSRFSWLVHVRGKKSHCSDAAQSKDGECDGVPCWRALLLRRSRRPSLTFRTAMEQTGTALMRWSSTTDMLG